MSLLETLLGFFLVTLLVVLILNLLPMAMASTRLAGQRVEADAVADSILDVYTDLPYSRLTPGETGRLPDRPGRGTVFQPRVEIFEVKDSLSEPGLLLGIRVHVDWTDHGVRRTRTREVWRSRVRR
ncbi:MAG: hypothetical protein AB1758_17060 [Candidatus Eremiobacterota bacterium]